MRSVRRLALLATLAIVPDVSVYAQAGLPSLQNSFRLGGGGGGALCQAQSAGRDPAISGMFDRSWSVVCRDSVKPVGKLYALRRDGSADDLLNRIAKSRDSEASCSAPGGEVLPDLGTVTVLNCSLAGGVPYKVMRFDRGKYSYFAQGYAGYSSALGLGLRTIVLDKLVEGQVDVATLGGSDNAGFARLQAATLDPQTTLAEGYRRNNTGDYAEAAEFFGTLQDNLTQDVDGKKLSLTERNNRQHEYLINKALQHSNLGQFDQADALFRQSALVVTNDAVQLRLARNFRAIHALNQRQYDIALSFLDRPVVPLGSAIESQGGTVELSRRLAAEINSSVASAEAMGIRQAGALTQDERAAIIDAQAMQLRGTILRLTGKYPQARETLGDAQAALLKVRGGRVNSAIRLRAQILVEIALTHEALGQLGDAENMLRQALNLLETQYPETVAVNAARARLAAFLVRHDRNDEALTLYRAIIASTTENRSGLTGLGNQIQPYFDLLAKEIPAKPALASDMFLASQTLVRPGAADTLEVLSRELSGGTDDAARLFRQSVSLSRDIERARIQQVQMQQAAQQDSSMAPLAAAKEKDIAALAEQQAKTLSDLAAYPQYRAVSKEAMTLADMQALLRPGEAYIKLAKVGESLYMVLVDGEGATGYKLGINAFDLETKVAAIRDTISTVENGVRVTYAFDVESAQQLYQDLFAPIAPRLQKATHLIFEPDGAMLQLPINLLITDKAGVDAYLAKADRPDADDATVFDFRGIQWLGRGRAVSTAVSVRSFADARKVPVSTAKREYIGFGENAPVGKFQTAALVRGASETGAGGINCDWSLKEWDKPISAQELRSAANLLNMGGSELVTGAAFTDNALLQRTDLNDFRILHFATHGLIKAPREGCPARPALLTSFGGANSDGLLKFSEIFDLRLNADLVILSACDTAAQASEEATRAAGLSTGGGTALDGLVRAFIGAGGRSVIASHWPAPEEFNATRRLFEGLFEAKPGEGIGSAMLRAEEVLMDDPNTSHPFFWSGFAIVGDGARPLISAR